MGQAMSADPVVIVGAGACGLVCALRLKALGFDAIVIERDATPSGSTALSSGFIPAAATRLQKSLGLSDSFELFAQDIQHKAKNQAPTHLVQAYVEGVAQALDWLEAEHGFDFEVLDGFLYPGHSVRRMHSLPQRTGAALMARLMNSAAKEQVTVLTQSRVDSLMVRDSSVGLDASHTGDSGSSGDIDTVSGEVSHVGHMQAVGGVSGGVSGVRYQTPEGRIETLSASAVMLACNGYGGNEALVKRYIPEMSGAMFAGHSGNDGSALRWGESLGAASADLSAYQGHGSWAVPQGALISWALMMDGGIQVNAQGARFHDETRGYSEAAVAVLAQPGGVAWNVIDQEGLQLARTFPDFVEAEKARAVKPLEGYRELDARQAQQTITGFNATLCSALSTSALSASTLTELALSESPFGRNCKRALVAPFYAIKVTGALFHTQGGLQVDSECRVLRSVGIHAEVPEYSVIPGLWAGGGAARGVSGQTVEGYLSGNGLLSAIAGGWIVAHSIATSLPRP
jgi:fumarate reductase flavoprotein subunit